MRTIVGFLSLAALAGCATPGAYTEAKAASAQVALHEQAELYFNLDLIDKAGATETARGPEVSERRERATACERRFLDSFAAMVDGLAARGAGGRAYSMEQSQALEVEFDRCVAAHGLTGYPEFKVGDAYLRTAPFLRSWYAAGERQMRADGAVENESQASGLGLAAALGGAGRAMADQGAYRPVQPVESIYRAPVRCTSWRYGTTVQTTCQ